MTSFDEMWDQRADWHPYATECYSALTSQGVNEEAAEVVALAFHKALTQHVDKTAAAIDNAAPPEDFPAVAKVVATIGKLGVDASNIPGMASDLPEWKEHKDSRHTAWATWRYTRDWALLAGLIRPTTNADHAALDLGRDGHSAAVLKGGN